MHIKHLNYFLIFLLFIIISGIIIIEIKYKRFDRCDWDINIETTKENEPIQIIKGYFSIPSRRNNKNFVIEELYIMPKLVFNNSYISRSHNIENELPPDSINVKWFSYTENKFYKLEDKIPFEKISSYLKSNNLSDVKITTGFKNGGYLNLYIKKDEFSGTDSLLIKSYQGIAYESKWELGQDRPSDVAAMNSKVVIQPELTINSQSKFRTFIAHYNDYSRHFDSISSNVLYGRKSHKGTFNSFSLNLKNIEKYDHKMLNAEVSYSNKEMMAILNQLSKEKVSISIQMTSLDSIKSIHIKDSIKKIKLKNIKVNYNLNYN